MFKLQRKWTLRQWNQVLLQVIVFYSGEKKLLCVKIKEDGIRSTIYKVPAKRTHRSINARLQNQNLCTWIHNGWPNRFKVALQVAKSGTLVCALGGQMVKNFHRLAYEFELDQS